MIKILFLLFSNIVVAEQSICFQKRLELIQKFNKDTVTPIALKEKQFLDEIKQINRVYCKNKTLSK